VWEATGSPEALRDLEQRIGQMGTAFDEDFDWGEVKNLGLLTYLFSQHEGRDARLVGEVRRKLIAMGDTIAAKAEAHGYGRALPRYYWGCNGSVARQCVLLEAAYRLTGERTYHDATLDALNYLLGRNVDGRSFVTGLGHQPPLHPHDRRSGGDEVEQPWPGYLVGGPHPRATSWKDLQSDYSLNEIAINWNGALIYALASALPPESATSAATP
jgi:endoglucanase